MLSALRERRAWMALPSSFNDPFDCQPLFLRNDETERQNRATVLRNYGGEVKRALKTGAQLVDRQGKPIAHRDLVNLKRVLSSALPDDRKHEALKRLFVIPPDVDALLRKLRTMLDRVGVFSLSATPKDMLMWAHYAGEHTGFCLGFERSRESMLADPARTKRVYYGEVYPAMDLDVVGLGWRVSIEPGVAITEEIEVDIQEPNLQTVIYSKAKDWEL